MDRREKNLCQAERRETPVNQTPHVRNFCSGIRERQSNSQRWKMPAVCPAAMSGQAGRTRSARGFFQ
jgi:hypothetical protein